MSRVSFSLLISDSCVAMELLHVSRAVCKKLSLRINIVNVRGPLSHRVVGKGWSWLTWNTIIRNVNN